MQLPDYRVKKLSFLLYPRSRYAETEIGDPSCSPRPRRERGWPWPPCVFLIPGPFGECRIFCIGAHTVGIWGKNQKQFSAEASRASERGKEIGEIAFDDSDSGERESERVRAWYNLLHVIHNTT